MTKKLKFPIGAEDALALVGAAALLYGIHHISVPAAFISAGLMLLALSALVVFRRK